MRRTVFVVTVLIAGWVLLAAAQQPSVLPMGPARERGASITPAYEGWYKNDDGSFSMLIGYYNRNSKEALTIPVGPNNKIEPGDPDQGQPTFFEMGRQWGVFVIKVPKDFGTKVIRWTLTANGETQSVPFTLNAGYPITPFKELGMGNQPPTLWFTAGRHQGHRSADEHRRQLLRRRQPAGPADGVCRRCEGEGFEGGQRGHALAAQASRARRRDVRARAHCRSARPASRSRHRRRSARPGEYLLRVQANDESGEGGGGFQCCWTNTYVKVIIK